MSTDWLVFVLTGLFIVLTGFFVVLTGLTLKGMGIDGPLSFDYMDAPDTEKVHLCPRYREGPSMSAAEPT